MKSKAFVFVIFFGFVLMATGQSQGKSKQNSLSKAEKKAGWKLLFDGTSLEKWRGFKGPEIPDSWFIDDGAIVMYKSSAKAAEDLITKEEFSSFELMLEWKISPGGNSGVMFHVSCDSPFRSSSETGPEMQVLDNDTHPDGKGEGGLHRAGAAYDLYPATREVVKPVGEYNLVRIVVSNVHVEHWLNGVKIVEYKLWSPEWETKVEKSKFSRFKKYGRLGKGHIALQDHGDKVWFRNVKIRQL